MATVLRNIAAVIVGIVAGGVANGTLITISPHVIPPPAGVNVSDAQSLRESIHLFGPQHFVFPFLAHAIGTFVGALIAYLIAGSRRAVFAYAIGAFFLVGGIAASLMIPAPWWFIVLDLVAAYLPMAWIAARLGRRITGEVIAPAARA